MGGIGDEPQWGGLDFNIVRKVERSPDGFGALGIIVPNPIGQGMKAQGSGENAGQQGAESHGLSVAGMRQKARFGVTVFASDMLGDLVTPERSGCEPDRAAS